MGGGLSCLYHCWHTNYRCASHLYRVLFCPNRNSSTKQLLAADLSYVWLYPNKQAVDRFAHLDHIVLPPGMLSGGSFDGGSLCPCCWRWQIIDREEYE